jgi:phage tail protein X
VAVKRGDTLSSVVRATYGRATLTLIDHVALANPGIADINVLDVGQRLRMPPLDSANMVHRENGSRHYLVHVVTLPTSAGGALDKLRPTIARQQRKVYAVPVRLTHNVDAYRVFVGDFEDRTQAEQFSQSFRPPAGLSDLLWG